MKRTILVTAAALIVFSLIAFAAWLPTVKAARAMESPQRERWEYTSLYYGASAETVNRLGSEGWELVTFETTRSHLWFKRKLR